MFVSAAVFSATERVAVVVAKLGASLTFVTLIVTVVVSDKVSSSVAVTVTE